MAYEKQEWSCGDPITADKMNHIEEGIENAQNGYECTEESAVLTEEDVTRTGTPPIAYLSYTQLIDASSITVTFDGTEYVLERTTGQTPLGEQAYVYSGSSSTPFVFFSAISPSDASKRNGVFISSSLGTHTIKIEVAEESVTTTSCFQKAVESVVKSGKAFTYIEGGTCGNNTYSEYNITYNDFINARNNGTNIVYAYALTNANEPQARNIIAFNCIEGSEWYEVQAFYVHVTVDVPPTVTWIPLVLFCDTPDGYMRDVNCWQLPS